MYPWMAAACRSNTSPNTSGSRQDSAIRAASARLGPLPCAVWAASAWLGPLACAVWVWVCVFIKAST
jgi:hypothetical protein